MPCPRHGARPCRRVEPRQGAFPAARLHRLPPLRRFRRRARAAGRRSPRNPPDPNAEGRLRIGDPAEHRAGRPRPHQRRGPAALCPGREPAHRNQQPGSADRAAPAARKQLDARGQARGAEPERGPRQAALAVAPGVAGESPRLAAHHPNASLPAVEGAGAGDRGLYLAERHQGRRARPAAGRPGPGQGII